MGVSIWEGSKAAEAVGALLGIKKNLAVLSAQKYLEIMETYAMIRFVISNGGVSMFQVVDQVVTKWTDRVPDTPVEYDNPFDIVQNDVKAILQDGEEVDAITIMQHYATPRDMPFDAREAAFVFLTAGSAGTYYFRLQEQPWCSGDVGKYITFTLTTAPPAGAQLVMNQSYNATAVGATISLYADGSATTPLETVTMSEGQTGTDLGALTAAGRNETTGVNSIH